MSASVEGEALRGKLKNYLDNSGAECNDRGIELDSRYKSSVIYLRENEPSEPSWTFKTYTPSTFPGSRAPHVFLKDRKTSILDSIKNQWTLFSFNGSLVTTNRLADIAGERRIPLQTVVLVDEDHVRKIWEYDLVLVRPDVSYPSSTSITI
jgi:FAD-dependent monooxygenase